MESDQSCSIMPTPLPLSHSTKSKVERPFVMQEAGREGAEMSAPQNREGERNNAKCPFMACVGLVLPTSS